MSLGRIRIVLSRPTHPGNIGSSARAMKNMGLSELVLVAPERFPHPEATALAADALDVLDAARVVGTLEEAIADCRLVIGSSARGRRIDWPTLSPAECAQRLVTESSSASVALVFGQERTGLTNEELDRCQYLVTIPTSAEYAALNLAAAVQILAYEIFRAHSMIAPKEKVDGAEPLATAEELQRLYQHMERVLIDIGFLNPSNPRLLMRRLMRLFGRTELDRNELNILRGILTAVQQDHERRHG
jgi:tRNA (cytidine32/uridine32-2'-O)-methyltransferase